MKGVDKFAEVNGALSEVHQTHSDAKEILASLPSGLMVVDANLNIRSINRAMWRLFGVPEEAGTIGLPLDKVIASSGLSSKLKEA
jgi:PAS domain-containing protein